MQQERTQPQLPSYRSDLGPARQASRLITNQEIQRMPSNYAPNPVKPPKRVFEVEQDEEQARPSRLPGGQTFQANESKRRRTEDAEEHNIPARPTMAPPVRQSNARKVCIALLYWSKEKHLHYIRKIRKFRCSPAITILLPVQPTIMLVLHFSRLPRRLRLINNTNTKVNQADPDTPWIWLSTPMARSHSPRPPILHQRHTKHPYPRDKARRDRRNHHPCSPTATTSNSTRSPPTARTTTTRRRRNRRGRRRTCPSGPSRPISTRS